MANFSENKSYVDRKIYWVFEALKNAYSMVAEIRKSNEAFVFKKMVSINFSAFFRFFGGFSYVARSILVRNQKTKKHLVRLDETYEKRFICFKKKLHVGAPLITDRFSGKVALRRE